MEGNMSASPEVMLSMLSRSSRACIVTVLLGLSLAILSPLIMFSLRWDNSVSWPWAVSFIPHWIFHALLYVPLVLVQGPPPPSEDEASDVFIQSMYRQRKQEARVTMILGLLTNTLAVIAEIFLALRLDGVIEWAWIGVLMPFILMQLLFLLAKAFWTRSASRDTSANDQPKTRWKIYWTMLHSLWWATLRFITLILVAARADLWFDGSWNLCFIPMFIGAAVMLLSACLKALVARPHSNIDVESGQDGFTQEYRNKEGLGGICWASSFVAAFLFMFCCGASKLDEDNISAFVVFLPIFVLVLCCVCCMPACLLVSIPGMVMPHQTDGAGGATSSAATTPAASEPTPATTASSAASGTCPGSSDDAPADLQKGVVVVVHGLTGATELNGQRGVCECWDENAGRWSVQLHSGGLKAVRPGNLRKM